MSDAEPRRVVVERLGRREYVEVLELQRGFQAERRAGGVDRLFLVEHEAVLTLGRAHREPKLRVGAALVEAAGIPIVETERGGDITYHGPGQLVAYVIVDLRSWGIGATDLVTGLEECAIRVLAKWAITGVRDTRNRGAWVGGRKIASVGINVRGGVSMHGIALNVAPDMEHFALIEPCGLADVEVTSMARELSKAVSVADVSEAFEAAFGAVFGCKVMEAENAPTDG